MSKQVFSTVMGNVLRIARGEARQEDVAARAGIAQSTLSRAERGEICLDVWVLDHVVKHLDEDIGAFGVQIIAWEAYEATQADKSGVPWRVAAAYHAQAACVKWWGEQSEATSESAKDLRAQADIAEAEGRRELAEELRQIADGAGA